MAEYIEREALIEKILSISVTVMGVRSGKTLFYEALKSYREAVLKIIKKAPTADVVEVVRCKDCEHYIEYPLSERAKEIALWGKCNKNKHIVYPTDFCSHGQRKEVANSG